MHRIEIPNAILLEEVRKAINEGHTATINVKGFSMRPFLENNREGDVESMCRSPSRYCRIGRDCSTEICFAQGDQ